MLLEMLRGSKNVGDQVLVTLGLIKSNESVMNELNTLAA